MHSSLKQPPITPLPRVSPTRPFLPGESLHPHADFWRKLESIPPRSDNLRYALDIESALWAELSKYGNLNARMHEYISSGGKTPSPLLDMVRVTSLIGALRMLVSANPGTDAADRTDTLRLLEADIHIYSKKIQSLADVTSW